MRFSLPLIQEFRLSLFGTPFRPVMGTWRVPAVTDTGPYSASVEWVGIDGWGFNTNDVIQTGTG